MSCINASVRREGGISVSVGLVCNVGSNTYLRVSPTETQWVTVDTSVDYNITSNTNWNIT